MVAVNFPDPRRRRESSRRPSCLYTDSLRPSQLRKPADVVTLAAPVLEKSAKLGVFWYTMSPGFSAYGPLLIQRIRAIDAKPDAHRSRWSHSRGATASSRIRSTVMTLRRRPRGREGTSSQKWHFDAQGRHQRDAVEQGLKHLLPTQKWSRRGHLRRRERLEELGPEFVTAPPKPPCRATASATSHSASRAGVTPATTKARRDVALVCSCDLRGPRLQRDDVGDA